MIQGSKNPNNHSTDTHRYESNGDGTHAKKHECCGVVTEANETCTGGTVTCTQKAVCTHCGGEYGTLAPHVYDQMTVHNEHTLAAPATCEDEAVYYYTCTCGEVGTQTYALSGSKNPNNHSTDIHRYESNSDGTHTKKHECCGAVANVGEACTGGIATCTQKAVCTHCGGEYGTLAPHVYDQMTVHNEHEYLSLQEQRR